MLDLFPEIANRPKSSAWMLPGGELVSGTLNISPSRSKRGLPGVMCEHSSG